MPVARPLPDFLSKIACGHDNIADIALALKTSHIGWMIETSRLILRPYQLRDFEPYLQMVTDPEMDFPGRVPVSEEDAWHRLLRYVGHWSLLEYGNFAIIEKASGKFIGETGIWRSHRGLGDDFDVSDEAGWFIASGHQKRGFAYEAASAAHRWYGQRSSDQRTVCMIAPENDVSIKIATNLGYQRFAERPYQGTKLTLFERTANGS